MPALETFHIDLPPEMAATVRRAVQTGDYASQNDAVQDAIRRWSHERSMPSVHTVEELRGLWMEAIADDSDGEDPDPIFDALERKYAALAEETGR